MRLRKSFYFFGPLILTGGAIFIFNLPKKIEKSNDKHYVYEDITVDKDKGIRINEKVDYFKNDAFFDRDYVNNYKNMPYNWNNFLDYEITDGINFVNATFKINNNGDLIFDSSKNGQKVSAFGNEYESEIIDDEYLELFDRIATFLNQDGYLDDESLTMFKKLSANDKVNLTLNIRRYVNLGIEEAEYYNGQTGLKVGYIIFVILFAIIYIIVMSEEAYKEGIILTNLNGELREKTGHIGFINMGTKYNEEFISAEKERIQKIIEIVKEIAPKYEEELLTNYEKKLKLEGR